MQNKIRPVNINVDPNNLISKFNRNLFISLGDST
jgi:hypothetical protein